MTVVLIVDRTTVDLLGECSDPSMAFALSGRPVPGDRWALPIGDEALDSILGIALPDESIEDVIVRMCIHHLNPPRDAEKGLASGTDPW